MVFNHVIPEIHNVIPKIHVHEFLYFQNFMVDDHVILETLQSKGEKNGTAKVMATAMAIATRQQWRRWMQQQW
jgi:hypothetical protein